LAALHSLDRVCAVTLQQARSPAQSILACL
jgi:hypothetical protein